MKHEAITYAYMAGLLDGDGCISIGRHPPSKKGGARFTLQVIVASTTKSLVEWPREKFGGGVFVASSGFAWRFNGQAAADLLTQCLPYFVEKREQAEIAIEFQRLKKERGQGASIHRQEALYEKLKSMHLSGGRPRKKANLA